MNLMSKSAKRAEERPNTSRDRHFQSFRIPRTDAAKIVVADVVNQIQNYEKHFGHRKRARKEDDQRTFEATIAAVVCDAVHRYCQDPEGRIAVTRSRKLLGRKSRYRSPALGNTLPKILDNLSAPEMDFIDMNKGGRWEELDDNGLLRTVGRQTTIQAGPALIRRIQDNDLWFRDLDTSDTEEIIILKAKKTRWDSGEWVEYDDTADTRRFRKELRSINEWLMQADIEFDEMSGVIVDPFARRLRRVFNNENFGQGGRLYGGFWMNLKEEVRCRDISIGGEAVAELDYGQMVLRQLYGKVGIEPPKGDLYAIPGMPWRSGVKKVTTAALYSSEPLSRLPKGSRTHFPKHISFPEVRDAILDYHAPIADGLFSGLGMNLMFEEAEIMIEVLRRTRDQSIVALPIHDSVLAPQSAASLVKMIMEDVFKEKTGLDAVVEVQTS